MLKLSALSLIALTILTGCAQQQPRGTVTASGSHEVTNRALESRTVQPSTSTAFDFYLLTLSWSPEYCHSHSSAAECAQHAAFVLHGLWPERSDGSYPENCSNTPGPSDPSAYADLYPEAGLLQHEWRTHGTCSGLSADAYFATVRSAYQSVKTPPKLTQLSSPTSLPPDQIASSFEQINPGLPASSIVVSCGNNYLTAVEVCLDKNLKPTSCGAVKACHANTVRIVNP